MSPTPPSNEHNHYPPHHDLDTPAKRQGPTSPIEQDRSNGTNDIALPQLPRLQRSLSPNELSYYLPSRAYGANDMCVSFEVWAPPELMTTSRLHLAWSILRLRHPLLSCHISHLKSKPPMSSDPASPTKKSLLDEYYRSAAFVLDPPRSPKEALEQSRGSLDLRLAEHEKIKSEDLLWDLYNGPRVLSTEELAVLTIVKSDVEGQGTRSATSGKQGLRLNSRTQTGGLNREQYVMALSATHCIMDGLSTFLVWDEFFQLVGASSAVPSPSSSPHTSSRQRAGAQEVDPSEHVARTESQLRALLHSEWALRYGAGSPLRQAQAGGWNGFAFMPASLESRMAPFANRTAAVDDFEQDQGKFQGGHALLRQSPSNPLSLSSTSIASISSLDPDFHAHLSTRERTHTKSATPNRHNVTRDLVFPPNETRRILRRCKTEGVSVQNAMFAAANVAWLRMLERARRATGLLASGTDTPAHACDGFKAMKAWAQKCNGLTLMYSAVNLRPLVGQHEHPLRIPEAFRASSTSQAAWRRQIIGPSTNSSVDSGIGAGILGQDSAYVALGYFNVQLPEGTKQRGEEAATLDFWARAREARKQTAEAVGSSNLISRNVLMGEERGARSVRFAMEDDGYVPRPNWLATPASPKSAAKSITSPASLPKAAPTPSPLAKAAPAAALMGLSLMGTVDATYSYHLYPTITPTLCRCGTRKAYGGMLIFSYSFRGSLCVGLGWDEKAFPEFDVMLPDGEAAGGVGIKALYREMRDVVAEFMLDAANTPAQGVVRGLDMSGRTRLREWDEDHYAVPLPKVKEMGRVVRHGVGTRPEVIQLAKL
ncbi:hypothetical protein DL93DRAFT_2154399 [Clavulina sp. PMI_390]|nr:hypothetical protein DL93DRAFT_2154399 [Clavulina sp. PMI_390]